MEQFNSDINIEKRLAQDLVKRMGKAIYAYPVLWSVAGVGGDFHINAPTVFYGALVVFTLLSIVRALHFKSLKKVAEENISRWLAALRWLNVPSSLIWGSLFAYALAGNDQAFILLMTFSTAGIVAGGVYNFAPDFKLSSSFILSLIIPAIIVTVFITHAWFLTLLLVVYLGFIMHMATNQKNDYWGLLNNELELEKKSHTDALTNLDNRRYFDQKLNEYCHLSTRNHEQLSVMLIDCDHFKQINDNYGHDVGDRCLKHVAKILQSELPRVTDVCARYGGEEFSIILPGTNLSGAKKVAERIRQTIAHSPLDVSNKEIHITVSIGSVSRHVHAYIDDLPEQLFKQADMALYRAKENGRNRSEFRYYDDARQDYLYLEADQSARNVEAS